MTDLITGEQVIEQLRAVVAEFGEGHVYQMVRVDTEDGPGMACMYRVGDKPSCLAAQVLHRLGVDLNLLTEGMSVGKQASGLGLTKHAARVLSVAQIRQDGGNTWGHVLHKAEAYHETYKDEELVDL